MILERASCRSFTAEPVPRATIESLLEAARWAPSGGNIQPWRFVVVSNDERKRRLVSAALGQTFIGRAPVVVVVWLDE